MKQGIFMDGSITGIRYECTGAKGAGSEGVLDEQGCFLYEEGDYITFSVGGLMLGSCKAKPTICTVDLVAEATSRLQAVTHYTVTNVARLLLSVGHFCEKRVAVMEKYRSRIQFSQEPEQFEASMAECLKELNVALISVARTHNIVRRCLKGILKKTDVKVPTRDGRYVLADVYQDRKSFV